jgi:hypothetical protein
LIAFSTSTSTSTVVPLWSPGITHSLQRTEGDARVAARRLAAAACRPRAQLFRVDAPTDPSARDAGRRDALGSRIAPAARIEPDLARDRHRLASEGLHVPRPIPRRRQQVGLERR